MAKGRDYLHPADKEITNMRYRDLKRACIVRGMGFQELLEGDFTVLRGFFKENYYNKINPKLLDDFDDYQEAEIIKHKEKKGVPVEDWVTAPELRLGFIGERGENGEVITTKRVKGITKKKKVKRERTVGNVFAGTKKALTFELQQKGLEKAEVIKKVIEAFPDASEKSISIWFNKSKKIKK